LPARAKAALAGAPQKIYVIFINYLYYDIDIYTKRADGMTSRTEAMERVKELRTEARQAEQGLKAAHRLAMAGIDVNDILEDLRAKQADALNEAKELKPLARLEDLSVYKIEKKGKKGKTNEYWHATWRHGHEVCNVYLGSCKKLAREQALQKARKMKAEDLGLRLRSMTFEQLS
jgi:hypothetical protein